MNNIFIWTDTDQNEITCTVKYLTIDIAWINTTTNDTYPCNNWEGLLAWGEDNNSLEEAKKRIEDAFLNWLGELIKIIT